jgi:hypothetical protein
VGVALLLHRRVRIDIVPGVMGRVFVDDGRVGPGVGRHDAAAIDAHLTARAVADA